MKKIIAMVALVFSCMLAYAQTNGEVIVMNKAMFIKDVFDYEKSQDWKYKGNKPAIIDLYADWCGPCRMVAPIMKELAKEYADKIVVYKVNVDKEKELAALFNATSIPLFVFIPMNGEPQHRYRHYKGIHTGSPRRPLSLRWHQGGFGRTEQHPPPVRHRRMFVHRTAWWQPSGKQLTD